MNSDNGNHGKNGFSMQGRIALVTGAGRGIGLAIAQALAGRGCAVAIQDIDQDVAASEARKIEQAGDRAIALGGDIRDLSLPSRLIDQTHRQLGGLHVLVNNAAIQRHQHWMEVSPEEAVEQLSANVVGPLCLCQLATPIFQSQKWGRIINLGSIVQVRGASGLLPYSLSKSALATLTLALARQLAGDRITVNMISPGYFNTYRNRHDFPDEHALAEAGKHVPIGRVGEPRDCGPTALLLASDAGEHITGQTIFIDGGMYAFGR